MNDKSDKQFVDACDSFRSPKVVKLEQQNEALLAQVEELRGIIETALSNKWDIPTGVLFPVNAVKARSAIAKTAQQSLDSLKVSIEEEAIERLIKKVINKIDWIAPSNFEMIASDLPRKYQPTEEK